MRTKGDAGLKFTNNQGWMLEVRKIEKMIVKVRVMARDGRWRMWRGWRSWNNGKEVPR